MNMKRIYIKKISPKVAVSHIQIELRDLKFSLSF